MTLIDHDTYEFELPAGWTVQPQPTEEIPLYMLFVNPQDADSRPDALHVVGSISDFTYFAQEGKRKIDMYDLVETFETWAHQRKLKFDEPAESADPRESIRFEVIGNATDDGGRRHFVWLLGDAKTVVRVHFVVSDMNDVARKVMKDVIRLVSSVRIA